MAIAIDPVCGMEVETDTTDLKVEHDGTTYWFCGKGCLLEFRDDPEQVPRRELRTVDVTEPGAKPRFSSQAKPGPPDWRRRMPRPGTPRRGRTARTAQAQAEESRPCVTCRFGPRPRARGDRHPRRDRARPRGRPALGAVARAPLRSVGRRRRCRR